MKAKALPWERAKAFNGAAVFSEFILIDNIDNDLSLTLAIDDNLVQAGGIELMMVKPDEILTQLKDFIDLEDGDVVMTGTPKGVGQIVSGSKFIGKVICQSRTLVSATWLAN